MADEKPSKKKKKKKNGAAQDQMVPQPSCPSNRAMVAQNPFDDQMSQQELMAQLRGGNSVQNLPTVMPALAPGKIYPSTQAMVFNHGNPNAPPIYPCGMCHKEVHDNDQAVFCESGCNFWFHRVCTGITEPAYQMLTAEVYAEWVCDKCLATKNIPVVKLKH